MINFSKFYKNITLITLFITLVCCQLKEPIKNHGILFLENRSNQLKISQSNKNDVIKLIGNPHTISINNNNDWIYIERTLTKGSFHKLGQNVLKTNNVLVLNFDKYGILKNKVFLDKNEINKLNFSKKITENNLSKKSFVQSFLGSIKTKMYSNRK
jgi:outer membrane protein assembly factor BamE (lipoprotein component of BamABCDE complex)